MSTIKYISTGLARHTKITLIANFLQEPFANNTALREFNVRKALQLFWI